MNKIKVSEHFHSIQGEGRTAGSQAVFLRLQSCNLLCGGKGTVKDGELHDGASWRCDTIETWLKGNTYTVHEAVGLLASKYGTMLKNGSHLIITGGEPLLQQESIVSLLYDWSKHTVDIKIQSIEVETNGTIVPDVETYKLVDLFNVSPKLANSGMPAKKRINDKAMRTFEELSRNGKAIFKFVVFDEQDLKEVRWYQDTFNLRSEHIYLMPACADIKQWQQKSAEVVEMSKNYGYNFSPRLQVAIWNKTVGV